MERKKEMNASGLGVVKRGGGEGEGGESDGGNRRDGRNENSGNDGKEWGVNAGLLNEMDKRLLKSLLNDDFKGEKRGLSKEEGDKSKLVKDKQRVTSPLNESKAWGWKGRGVEKRLGRQSSRFERSMRVLEWLDADCGTRLAQHYEQAGGWRSLPQRRQRQQACQNPQRKPLRLTRSHLVLGTERSEDYEKDTEDDSSSDEEEKKVLEDSEDFLNDVDAHDDDDLVLALRRWEEEQVQLDEQYEEISMKEYVTSSEDDEDKEDEDSDSEDELVLALQAWKEEQQRQEKLQQQLQLHRQNSLAQQPPTLPPVLEDKVSSPTHEAFGYFYQDHGSLLHQFTNQRQKTIQQSSSVTPYWWGGISSVREGPSSPPILVSQSYIGKHSYPLVSPRLETSIRPSQAQPWWESDINNKVSTSFHGTVPSLTVTSAATHGSVTSLHTALFPPPSPFLSSTPSPSPRIDSPSWNFSRVSGEAVSLDVKGSKISDNTLKSDIGAISPRTPLVHKTSSGGFSVFSNWLGSSSSEKHNSNISGNVDAVSESRYGEVCTDRDSQHRYICTTLSTASSDSGIEKSPGYLSPAPRSAGIEKIGDFFRRFHQKLSTSSSSSSTKTTPPPTPGKQQQQQQQQQPPTPPQKHAPRRLSLSTPSIPASSLLKPSSPSHVAKFAAAHTRCTVTKSDPLAAGLVTKRQQNQWSAGQQTKTPAPLGPVNTSSRPLISDTNVDNNCSNVLGERGTVSGVGSGGQIDHLTSNSGAATSGVAPSDRKGDSNIDIHDTSCVSELKTGSTLSTHSSINIGKVVAVTGKEDQPFYVPPSYQHLQYSHSLHQHQPLTAKRSTGEISRKNYGQESSITDSGHSVKKYFSRDNLDVLKKSNEALNSVSGDNDNVSSGAFASGGESLGFSRLTKAASQILRKSPVSEIEQTIQSDSVERDRQGKIQTFSSGGISVSVGGGSVADSGSAGGGGNEDSSNVKSGTDFKRKDIQHKEEIMCSEVSSSTNCDERGTLSVPSAVQDRGRRGSHGTCNYLFLEQTTGGKSPKAVKGRKSPSPIRNILFKSTAQNTSTSSSSSADSSKVHHQIINRVQSLPSPSSPPPHQQQTPKTSPKHMANLNQSGAESPSKKIISDGPPINYHGRRKFSDTGLTPVPRRLFNEGRRGSLTDERTLVFAKSKLGKLRNQGRKSSDAGSIAVLVKQIHNLWEEKDDDEEEDVTKRRESVGGLSCSYDDQVLFDKKRKRFSLSIGKHKDKDLFSLDSRKLCKNMSQSSDASNENTQFQGGTAGSIGNLAADGKCKKKAAEKTTHMSLMSLNTSTPAPSAHASSLAAEVGTILTSKKTGSEDVTLDNEPSVGDGVVIGSGSGLPSSCAAAASSSGFVAPVAHVASRQLVATAVSSAACLVGMETAESLINRGTTASMTNISTPPSSNSTPKTGKKTATVQFQPIVSWDDNVVGGKISPALRSVLKNGARRHSSFAGFSESSDNLSATQHEPLVNLSSVLNKQAKNGLPKSKTSDNYKGILKQTDRPALANIDVASSSPGEKKKTKSPSPKSRKNDDISARACESKGTETSLSLCLKAARSVSPKSKKSRGDGKEFQETTDQSSQAATLSSSGHEEVTNIETCFEDHSTKTIGIQATPRNVGKTSNTGTQTSDLPGGDEFSVDNPSFSSEGGGWLQRLAAKCMASVGGSTRPGSSGVVGGLPRAASVRAEWLLSSKRMGSGPSSPSSADPSEKFWVPHEVIARKRAQSLVPTLSKSEDDLSSEAVTPASASHPRDLAFIFPSEKAGGSGVPSDGQPSTPTSGYNLSRRRASMHDAIDLTKIDTRLYDKKLTRQTSVSSIEEEESQGTIHISLEHNSETNILTVNLVRAHNLLPRDPDGTANPYCRLTLLPSQRASAQCRIHRKTLNPVFEEEFIFELNSEEVAHTTLEVSLYEYDQFSKDECVGYVRISLEDHDLSKQVDLWRSFSPCEKPKDKDVGDVMFSISYLPSAERLTVVIVRARNLHLQDESKVDLNPFIKVSIISGNKKTKKKKTSTAHGTNCPTWNEALVFSVHREKLQHVGMEIAAYHDNKLGSDECIGRIRLPANSEKGIHCQELLSEKSMPSSWYSLR